MADGVILQEISYTNSPYALASLPENITVWAERRVSPSAIVTALGHIAGRCLNKAESRNATAWIEEETARYQVERGEQ